MVGVFAGANMLYLARKNQQRREMRGGMEKAEGFEADDQRARMSDRDEGFVYTL